MAAINVDMLILYDLILVAIVGSYMATNVLRKWSIATLNRDPAKAAERVKAAAARAAEKAEAKATRALKKAQSLTDKARHAAADSLEDTADAIRPEDDK
jgi:3-hydroxyisobutyrate dehydrogenase-like beta-hydroxyacid dehydrogenase